MRVDSAAVGFFGANIGGGCWGAYLVNGPPNDTKLWVVFVLCNRYNSIALVGLQTGVYAAELDVSWMRKPVGSFALYCCIAKWKS